MPAAIVRPDTTLPDPKTETLKLGKGPRRYYNWWCGWAAWPTTQSADDYKGTPATHRDTRHTAALCRLIFMTRAEAVELADYHMRGLDKFIKGRIAEGKQDPDKLDEWWGEAEGRATIKVPAWLARDLERLHNLDFIKKRAAAAAVYTFFGLPNTEICHWCEYAEQRAAEARRIDDEAFAALSGILRGEPSGQNTAKRGKRS
ncbi:MAG: hypothetical protein AAF593_00295 [Planctomycetota bacterium]